MEIIDNPLVIATKRHCAMIGAGSSCRGLILFLAAGVIAAPSAFARTMTDTALLRQAIQGNAVALNTLKALANKGDAFAGNGVGICEFRVGHRAHAIVWFKKAAEAGNATACYNLGTCYLNGMGVQQNGPKALHWIRVAAVKGNPAADDEMGSAIDVGTLRGMVWIRKAAKAGYIPAYMQLATADGVLQKWGRVYDWLRRASAKHWGPADRRLGDIYAHGYGMQHPIYSRAALYYRRAIKESGDLRALQGLGLMWWESTNPHIVAAATAFALTRSFSLSKLYLHEMLTGVYQGALPPGAKPVSISSQQLAKIKAILASIKSRQPAAALHAIDLYLAGGNH